MIILSTKKWVCIYEVGMHLRMKPSSNTVGAFKTRSVISRCYTQNGNGSSTPLTWLNRHRTHKTTPHIAPLRGSYEVSVRILEKTDRVIMAPYSTNIHFQPSILLWKSRHGNIIHTKISRLYLPWMEIVTLASRPGVVLKLWNIHIQLGESICKPHLTCIMSRLCDGITFQMVGSRNQWSILLPSVLWMYNVMLWNTLTLRILS